MNRKAASPIILMIAIFIMLPLLSGCKLGGGNPLNAPADMERGMLISPEPNLRTFILQPIGPADMFQPDGYSPICENDSPSFTVQILAPSEGPLADVKDVKITTAIDGEIVPQNFDSNNSTAIFSPAKSLQTGQHIAAIQLTLDNSTYPPVVADWLFDVYNDPPGITSVLYDEKTKIYGVLFNRPVPEGQILDTTRWDIDSNYFAEKIETEPGRMIAVITAKADFPDIGEYLEPVTLNFQSNKGIVSYVLFKGKEDIPCEREGEAILPCDGVYDANFDPRPGNPETNPHRFDENEPSAWAYYFYAKDPPPPPGHCPIAQFGLYTFAPIERIDPWDPLDCEGSFLRDQADPHAGSPHVLPWWLGHDSQDGLLTYTFPLADDNYAWVNIYADNEPHGFPDGYYETTVSQGEVNLSFQGDKSNPSIIYGPHILTGWQAAREIEGIVANPGDGRFYYNMLEPPTLEGYIEELRTTWADHIFVMAGGADPGGNLRMVSPLALDIYDPPMTCPPTQMYSGAFLLRYDASPLGAGFPPGPHGNEHVEWPDPMYPYGFPNDDHSFNETEYALWDITNRVPDICNDEEFKMRVRVTDHVSNWKRSGIMDMGIGVEGIDSGVDVEILKFYAISGDLPDYLYEFCDIDCKNPQSCEGNNTSASSIEMRDQFGNCSLHLVVKCSALKMESFPGHLTAFVTSNEPYVPEGSLGSIYKYMWPASPEASQKFDELFGSTNTPLCYRKYYTCSIPVTDNPNDIGSLYVSHDDEAYPGYPGSDECEDYTVIYDMSEPDKYDFVRLAQAFSYGHLRGDTKECKASDNSYFSEDRCIQVGGFQVVKAILDDWITFRPVQSAADLIIISSHGLAIERIKYYGVAAVFSAMRDCECPPAYSPFTDSIYFSPRWWVTQEYGQWDNDFENNNDDKDDFQGNFWQAQSSSDSVTWVIFLGCGILNDKDSFAVNCSPLESWTDQIGRANAICGYSYDGAGWHPVTDYIGSLFSDYMELNSTTNGYLYQCNPPVGYDYRPIRAWMEAHCKALNEYSWGDSHPEIHTRALCERAVAIDRDKHVWIIEWDREHRMYKIDVCQ